MKASCSRYLRAFAANKVRLPWWTWRSSTSALDGSFRGVQGGKGGSHTDNGIKLIGKGRAIRRFDPAQWPPGFAPAWRAGVRVDCVNSFAHQFREDLLPPQTGLE